MDLSRPLLALALLALTLALGALLQRLRRRRAEARFVPRVAALVASDLPGGRLPESLALVYFTSRFCSECKEVPRIAREAAPELQVVAIDVADRPDLAAKLALFETPTVLLVDERGRIRYAKAGLPEATELWTYAREAWDSTAVARRRDSLPGDA